MTTLHFTTEIAGVSRAVMSTVLAALVACCASQATSVARANEPAAPAGQARPPSFVILFADDLGYGDLGCYGHPTIRTPHLDRMAGEGMRLTQFYSAAPVCTPSRAALLTGRLPIRSGMSGGTPRRVLYPNSPGGLPASEITLAELLKERGYKTACIGKWHLGCLREHLPMRHGFDEWFGIPYSNDMKPTPLMRGEQVLEEPAVQETLTRRYTEEAVRFIEQNRAAPFLLYLAYTFPHVPLFASDEFRGRSPRGLYGDVVEELDASVGRILQALRDTGLADNTLVVFTSDNGPWLVKKLDGGSAGLLREGKGSTWEGGMRVPGIFWWPGKIRPAVRLDVASTLDLLPTLARLAGASVLTDRVLDGMDISRLLLEGAPLADRPFFYYHESDLFAVRKGPWKIHTMTQVTYREKTPTRHDPPLLFHLERDPSEQFNVAADHPDVVADLLQEMERHRQTVEPVPCQLEPRDDEASRWLRQR
jgi:arylsulfatase A